MYIDNFADVVSKNSNTYNSTIKRKPADFKSSKYNFNKENNKKDPKFEVGDPVRTSNYTKVSVIKKVKKTVPWTFVISDLNDQEITGTFQEKNCKKQMKKSLELRK